MLFQKKEPQGASEFVKETTTAGFVKDVIEASKTQPVLVDFWAPWCGPCKQLTPVLEKAVAAAQGRVRLVKMNIDAHPAIAGQMGIQSIPAVIAFSKGQPVDGFMGALPESQIKAFIDRVAGDASLQPEVDLVKAGQAALDAGDVSGAAQAFGMILQSDPHHAAALVGMARCAFETGNVAQARQMLGMLPSDHTPDAALLSLRAALDLAQQAEGIEDVAALEARLAALPDDPQLRYDLALALAAKGRKAEAVDHLLSLVRTQRSWNHDAARKQLLQLFEAWGAADPATIAGRRGLSSLLFS